MKFFWGSLIFLMLFVPPSLVMADPIGAPQVELMNAAESLPFESLSYFDRGIYGKIGEATVFVTSHEMIEDYDRLYWSMVQVLSLKYGCFIRDKKKLGNKIQFACADRRTIVMTRDSRKKLLYFYAYQYWEDGTMVKIDETTRHPYAH